MDDFHDDISAALDLRESVDIVLLGPEVCGRYDEHHVWYDEEHYLVCHEDIDKVHFSEL